MQDRLRVAVTIVAVAIAALQTVSCHPFKSSQQGSIPNQFAQILDAGIDGSKRNLHSFKETSKILSTHDAITRRHRAPSTQLHDVVIVLEQKNMKELTRILHDVSDPTSPNYGKHLTREEVRDLTSNMESHDEIVSYLRGVGAKVIEEKYKGETITARAPIEVWERMFDTEFFVYAYENLPGIESTTSAKTETIIIRTEEYSVPKGFDGHVAAVLNTVEIPVSMHLTSRPTRREPLVTVGPNKFAVASKKFDGYTSPQLLTEVYKIDDSTGHPRATQGVFEAFNQYYSPEDIEIFQLQFELPNYPVNRSTADRAQTSDFCATNDFEVCIGPNLDLQYIMAMAQTPTTNYYTPLTTFGLWAQALFNTDKHPPLVISISYGTEERVTSKSEFDLFNTFAQKLGVIGVTLVAGSGDDGVSRPSVRVQKRDCGYSPQFPASCPYVTAVGATQGIEAFTQEIVLQGNKGGVMTSGGGFSTYFPVPEYQKASIAKYFSLVTGTPKAPFAGYANGAGYPDLAAAGANYLTITGGIYFGVSGVSVSTPVMAGILSLVNVARIRKGTPSIGWINPIIWGNSQQFVNDVTIGKNNCTSNVTICCVQGFSATAGWDPASGHGSLDFTKFRKYMLGLVAVTDPPTTTPTQKPTDKPIAFPTSVPVAAPTSTPTAAPTAKPSSLPTSVPVAAPTPVPTPVPSQKPSALPTSVPVAAPTSTPTAAPTATPSALPTSVPVAAPTSTPTAVPTAKPSSLPTSVPTPIVPTLVPTPVPSPSGPTLVPTPTPKPSALPTPLPTPLPSQTPSALPTSVPVAASTLVPTVAPTPAPSSRPTAAPTQFPTPSGPTPYPITSAPTPTPKPSALPSLVAEPTPVPTAVPSSKPNAALTTEPSFSATKPPVVPTSSEPSAKPINPPTMPPSAASAVPAPSKPPGFMTFMPSVAPNQAAPTAPPMSKPTGCPTKMPISDSMKPSCPKKTGRPHKPRPTRAPSSHKPTGPTANPSKKPTMKPSKNYLTRPTHRPTTTKSPACVPTTRRPTSTQAPMKKRSSRAPR